MKKKSRIVLVVSLLLIVGVFSLVLISCKDNSNTAGNIDTGDFDIGDIDVGDVDVGDMNSENSQKKIEKTVNNEFVFRDIAELNKLVTNNEVGYITVEVSEDNSLRVEAKTIITAYSKNDFENIQDNIDVKKSTKADNCTLSVLSKESGSDLWKWLDKKVGKCNVSVGLTIQVPANFKDFELNMECGSIRVTGLKGTFDLKAEVGGVTVDQCQLKDNCVFEAETGNIELSLCENLDYNALVNIVADTGNVTINLNKNPIEYTSNNVSSIKALINEKYSVTAETETGTINIDK